MMNWKKFLGSVAVCLVVLLGVIIVVPRFFKRPAAAIPVVYLEPRDLAPIQNSIQPVVDWFAGLDRNKLSNLLSSFEGVDLGRLSSLMADVANADRRIDSLETSEKATSGYNKELNNRLMILEARPAAATVDPKALLSDPAFVQAVSSLIPVQVPITGSLTITEVISSPAAMALVQGLVDQTIEALMASGQITTVTTVSGTANVAAVSSVTPTAMALAPNTAAATISTTCTVTWPVTANQFLAWVTEGQPAAPTDKSWIPIQLAEVHHPVDEPDSWAVNREKNKEGYIIPFWVRNPSKCTQDGWMLLSEDRVKLGRKTPAGAVGSGIPAGWKGLAQGATFRPVPVD